MIETQKPYDAEFHARNQQKHGSWALKLVNGTTLQPCEQLL